MKQTYQTPSIQQMGGGDVQPQAVLLAFFYALIVAVGAFMVAGAVHVYAAGHVAQYALVYSEVEVYSGW